MDEESDFDISDIDDGRTDIDEKSDTDTSENISETCEDGVDLSKTSPFLSKYERAKIIGIRAEQICNNAPILIEIDPIAHLNEFQIAEMELMAKKLNFTIRRYVGFGRYEDRMLNDLIITEDK